jgi:putative transposase
MDAPLPIRWSRPSPQGATPTAVTVSRDTAGRYFVSLLGEEEIAPLPPAQTPAVGPDLGLHDAVVLDTGEQVGNPRFFPREARRRAQAQRRLADKPLGPKDPAQARRAVARIHARSADRRRDFLHKRSPRMIRENPTICIASLRVKAMVKHPTLAPAIHDVGGGEFVRQLTYKAAWHERTLIAMDKRSPSSKRCSDCGPVLGSPSLDTRSWTCPECGGIHDRDVNAAENVLAAGLAVSACGEAVRPGRGRPDLARLGEAGIPRL